MPRSALTARQERFVEEYLKDYDTSAAYRRAGYSGPPKYSAWRMLTSPLVRAAIDRVQRADARDLEVDAERVIAEYAAIAFASIGDILAADPDGRLRIDVTNADRSRLPALAKFDLVEYRTRTAAGPRRVRRLTIRLLSKLDALDALARRLGLFGGRRQPAAAESPAGPLHCLPPPDQLIVRPMEARRRRFVAEYLRSANAAQSYARAGYSGAHGSARNAWRLLREPDVDAAISAGRRHLAERCAVSAARVLSEYARIAFATLDDYLDVRPDGTACLNLAKSPRDRLAALSEIVVEAYIDDVPAGTSPIRSAQLTLASKQRALDALARHLGLFGGPESLVGHAEDLRTARLRANMDRGRQPRDPDKV